MNAQFSRFAMPLILTFLMTLLLTGCAVMPASTVCPPSPSCPTCPVCPVVEPPKPEVKPLQPAAWSDLPDWTSDDPLPAFEAFRASCATLVKRPLWRASCESALTAKVGAGDTARAWFEGQLQPWALTQPDGSRTGLVTGYYEPLIRGSRAKKTPYLTPVFAPPADLIV
ncbi:MAG: MltA domain-containing protein, partial [Rhodocyclaceae bacterium]|nr:MltA domain-containing protein [Rhodocyclaceae bacterium]